MFISEKEEYDDFVQMQAERDMLQKKLDKLIGENGQENNELALMVDDHILDEPMRAIAKQNLNEPSEDDDQAAVQETGTLKKKLSSLSRQHTHGVAGMGRRHHNKSHTSNTLSGSAKKSADATG